MKSLIGSLIGLVLTCTPSIPSHIYWIEEEQPDIYRASLDGSNVEFLRITGRFPPRELVMADNQIYWTESNTGVITSVFYRAPLDGGSKVKFLGTGGIGPHDLALDVAANQIYWMQGGSISRASLDRWGTMTVPKMYWVDRDSSWASNRFIRYNGPPPSAKPSTLVTGLKNPRGLALDVAGNQIYWTDEGSISRASLDGSNAKTLVTGMGLLTSIGLGP